MAFTVRSILEVVGYPEAHVNEVRDKVLEKLRAEEGMSVLLEHIDPAAQLEGETQLFGSFVDVELKIDSVVRMYHFCMDYLPSSIEIVDKKDIFFDLPEFTTSLNDLLQRLHQLNVVISNLHRENKRLKKQFGLDENKN